MLEGLAVGPDKFIPNTTFTETVALDVQPTASVPTTVYKVVNEGNAATLDPIPVDGVKPVVGDQAYVNAPEAESVVPALPGTQILGEAALAETGFTVLTITATTEEKLESPELAQLIRQRYQADAVKTGVVYTMAVPPVATSANGPAAPVVDSCHLYDKPD